MRRGQGPEEDGDKNLKEWVVGENKIELGGCWWTENVEKSLKSRVMWHIQGCPYYFG
jgi:hypothetical protein